jgi:TBC1 domain family member 14
LPLIRNKGDLAGNKNFKESLKKGVPLEVRGEVWEALIGNEQRVNLKLY